MRKPWQAIVVGTASGNNRPPAGEKRTSNGKPAGRAGRQPGKKQRILAWLAGRGWDRVSEARAVELGAAFPDCSEPMRRAALLESGLALDPLVEGVRQESYERLESTLKALLREYEAAKEAGNERRRQAIRAVVIRAKEHAELAAHNSRTGVEKRVEKIEMARWLRTWLENPPVFPDWATLRQRQLGRAGAGAEAEEPPEGD